MYLSIILMLKDVSIIQLCHVCLLVSNLSNNMDGICAVLHIL